MTDKTLTIKIHTDLGDAVAAQTTLQKAIQGTGAALQQVSTTAKNFFNGTAWETEYNHIVKVTGAINALKTAESAVKGISGFNDSTFKGGSRTSDLATAFKAESNVVIKALQDRFALEKAIREQSNGSMKVMQLKAAAEEKAIYEKLATDLQGIQSRIANGVIPEGATASKFRNSAIVSAETALRNVLNNLNIEKAAIKEVTDYIKHMEDQAITNAQSFAKRMNSVPRISGQGSQIDMIGGLTTAGKQAAESDRAAFESKITNIVTAAETSRQSSLKAIRNYAWQQEEVQYKEHLTRQQNMYNQLFNAVKAPVNNFANLSGGSNPVRQETTAEAQARAQKQVELAEAKNNRILTLLNNFNTATERIETEAAARREARERAAADRSVAIAQLRGERLSRFKSIAVDSTALLSRQLELEQSIRVNGINSIQTILIQAAHAEEAVQKEKANKLQAIEKGIEDKSIATLKQANAARIAIEQDAANKITAIRRSTEAVQARTTARNTAADTYRRETQQIQQELDRRIAIEVSTRVNGVNHIRTIELQAAADEIAIRRNATNQINAIETGLRNGSIANIAAANARTAVINQHTQAQIIANRETLAAAQATARLNAEQEANARNHTSFIGRAAEFIGVYRVLNGVINTVSNAIRAIPKIGIERESTLASLSATVGTGGMDSAFAALTKEAKRSGIELDTVRQNFRTFQASASLAGESLKDVWHMFTNINTVSTALHLSTDKVQLTFLAISQIFNKTKVQSEELVKQLGNLLPGAFASFVQANKQAGESTQEASLRIVKAMKAGTVAAHDTILKFTDFYALRFAGAFELARQGLNANLASMKTSFQLLGEAIYGLSSGPILSVVKGLGATADAMTYLIKATGNLSTAINTGLNVALGVTIALLGNFLTTTKAYALVVAGLSGAFTWLSSQVILAQASIAAFGVTATATGMAVGGLEVAFAFLSSPLVLIAGIVAVGKALFDLGQESKDLDARLEANKKKFEELAQGMKKSPENVLTIAVNENANVIQARKDMLEYARRLNDADIAYQRTGINNSEYRLELTRKLTDAIKVEADTVKLETENIKDRLAQEAKSAEDFKNLQLGNAAGETDTKRAKESEDLRALQDKYNRNTIDIANAQNTAQIKELERLTKAKVDSFKLEKELAEEKRAKEEITAKQLADIKIDLLEKEKAVVARMYDERAALQKKELTDTVNNVKAAHEAIRMIESSGGTNRKPNISYKTDAEGNKVWNGTMLGPGQMSTTNLVNGTEVTSKFQPAIDEKVWENRKDLEKMTAFAEKHWTALGQKAEDYFYGLVDKFYKKTKDIEKAIRMAVNQYGEHTPKYMADFERNYAVMNKSAEGIIKVNDRVAASEQEKADLMTRIAKEQVAVREELAKANAAADKAQLDSLDKMLAKTASAEEAYQATIAKLTLLEGQVNSKGEKFVSPSDSTAIRGKAIKDFNIAKDKELSTPIEKAIPAVKRYEESLKKVNNTTKEFGSISNDIFNASLKGFSQLAGVTQRMVESQKNLTDRLTETQTKYGEAVAGVNASKYADPAQRAQDLFNLKEKHAITLRQYEEESLQNTLGGISQMMAATSQMFEQNSAEAKAFNIIALAGLAAKAAAAMLTQGEGDPYTAFARIAAMGAVVASILATAGAGGFNFSSSGPSLSKEQKAKIEGTGTVLGDSSTVSNSVTNIADLLKSIHADEYVELRGINKGIQTLQGGITDTITRVFQGGGLTSALPTGKDGMTGIGAMIQGSTKINIDPIGNLISKKILGGLFGITKYANIGTGISTGATLANDILNGGNVNAKQFDVIQKSTKSWFKQSFSYKVQFSDLEENVNKSLNSVFSSIGFVMQGLAKELGHDLEGKLRAYIIPGLSIDLKGLNSEDAVKKLNGVLSATLDTMATSVFGSILTQYQQLGEGMLETAIRIVSEVAVVKDALSASGLSIKDNAIAISDSLVQAANGLEEFQKQFDTFYDKFFTDAEKQIQLTNKLGSQLGEIFSPEIIKILAASREGYRQVISAIDLTTEAGQLQYSTLLALSSAADQWYTTVYDTQNKILDDAKNNLEAAYKRESDILQQSIDKLDAFSKALKEFKDSLVLSDSSILTPGQKYAESAKQYSDTKAIIAGGAGSTEKSKKAFEDAMSALTGKAQAFLDNSRIYNASSQQYTNDFSQVLSDINSGIVLSEVMKTDQEKQLDALNASVAGLITLNESVLSVRDAILAMNKAQTGIDLSNNNVHTAMTDFTSSLGRQLTIAEATWVIDQFGAGRTKESIYAEAEPYIKVHGSHADGLRSVPFDGYIAQLHKGEQVLTAQQVKDTDSTSQEILAELKYLREVVSKFHNDHNESTNAIIQSNYNSADKAAGKVSQSITEAENKRNWSNKSKVELA